MSLLIAKPYKIIVGSLILSLVDSMSVVKHTTYFYCSLHDALLKNAELNSSGE